MFGLPLAFAAPAVLAALIGLVGLYFLLRVTPPSPRQAIFPPLRLLLGLDPKETTPARTPWPILALRLAIGALIILAMAQPLWNSLAALSGPGPLLVLIDDGFAAAPTWDKRIDFARQRAEAAARSGRIVAIEPLSQGGQEIAPLDRPEVEGRLRSLAPVPYAPDREAAAPAIKRFLDREPGSEILWIADGIELGGASAFSTKLASMSHSVEVVTDGRGALALAGADNEAGALTAELTRSDARAPATGVVRALDVQGREVGKAAFDFGAKTAVGARFDLPVELRNDVTQVVVDGERSAGAVWLIDERSHRRRVAIASGASADVAQPLLAPSYYLRRALHPFADISEWRDSSTDPIVSLLAQKPSVLALADMSIAPGPELDAINQFLDNGGVLLRFAGTHLAAGDDPLTPTALRRGGRLLGGALSWETPKHIAPFEAGSPFFGLAAPEEVTVTRQVLAEPEPGLAAKTWARLADGTPLVTAERRGKGLIVLFHVTADTTWSNLPLSGLFVDMLRRIVAEADAPGQGAPTGKAGEHGAARPPLHTLSGFGVLGPPPANAEPIGDDFSGAGDPLHPPGFYGTPDSLRAVNALAAGASLARADYGPLAVHEGALAVAPPIDLRRWLLPAALVGLMIDALVSIWLMGGASLRRRGALAAFVIIGALGLAAVPYQARAAEAPLVSDRDMDAALSTRLAYVLTGDASVDQASKLGLTALTRVLAARTSAELAEPVGLDPARDELAFYPLIYWPIVAG
ncbi:MAG TPA: BatA domain-containing protein, partial [Roseiarcus sp.]|nr:BatA domain-containing protein [Roseiarcus sp.]